ncbi:MAG: recombinase family protein [Methylovirgula sp.]|uniref:recombinase family protein n=1 Tax=Methylovirgula sp. TaxID=1978224 RepID=UPI0030761811
MAKLVAYCRVSTQSQGRSGLGLAAQLDAIRNFAKSEDHEIIRPEYVEIESGAKDDRPKLALAVKQCRTYGATLVVAKADRLTRSGETVDQFAKRNRISVIALDNVNGDDVFAILSAAVGSVERS